MEYSKNQYALLIPPVIRLRETMKDVIAKAISAPVLVAYDFRSDLAQAAGMCPGVISDLVNFWTEMRMR